MRDLDRIHTGCVERGGNAAHVIQAVLVADGVAAVAQSDIRDIKLLVQIHVCLLLHGQAAARLVSARRSAQASAALVMMSRLPA
ncbi:hypothetical protein D9M69_240540 [compost metagenome]